MLTEYSIKYMSSMAKNQRGPKVVNSSKKKPKMVITSDDKVEEFPFIDKNEQTNLLAAIPPQTTLKATTTTMKAQPIKLSFSGFKCIS